MIRARRVAGSPPQSQQTKAHGDGLQKTGIWNSYHIVFIDYHSEGKRGQKITWASQKQGEGEQGKHEISVWSWMKHTGVGM